MIKRIGTFSLALFLTGSAAYAQASEADILVRTVLDKQRTRTFWFHLRTISFGYLPYVFDVRARMEKYDGKGKIKEPSVWSSGIFTPVEGVLLYTPVDFGGKPPTEKELNSWERKRDEILAQAKGRSESEKAKLRANEEKKQKERAAFWDEFGKAFRFQLIDYRTHNGRPTAVIEYSPLPGYKPAKVIDTKYLPKLRGQIWIDQADRELARFEMEFTEDVTSGFGLVGKVSKGTSYSMDLRKLIDDRWLPVRAEPRLRMRQLLVTQSNDKYTVEYGNYRKFSTDSRILSTEPVADSPQGR